MTTCCACPRCGAPIVTNSVATFAWCERECGWKFKP